MVGRGKGGISTKSDDDVDHLTEHFAAAPRIGDREKRILHPDGVLRALRKIEVGNDFLWDGTLVSDASLHESARHTLEEGNVGDGVLLNHDGFRPLRSGRGNLDRRITIA